MADFITLQLANEEVDWLRAENKDLRDEIYRLNVHINSHHFKDENAHLRAMSQRLMQALAEMAPLTPHVITGEKP